MEVVTGGGGGPRCRTTPYCALCCDLNLAQRLAMRAQLIVIPRRDPVCDQCVEAPTANLFASFPKTEEEKMRRREEMARPRWQGGFGREREAEGMGETQPTGVKNPRQGATFRNEGARLTTHDRCGIIVGNLPSYQRILWTFAAEVASMVANRDCLQELADGATRSRFRVPTHPWRRAHARPPDIKLFSSDLIDDMHKAFEAPFARIWAFGAV
jgi:hypothetical protein